MGALLNVQVSLGAGGPVLTGGVNNFSNPTVGPITLHVMCRICSTMGVPVVNVNNVRATRSIVRVVLTNTATIRIKTTGLIGPCTYHSVVGCLPGAVRGCGVGSLARVVKNTRGKWKHGCHLQFYGRKDGV